MYSERQNPHDKLYDSRRGLGAYYRYGPRDLGAICRQFGIEAPRIHISAIDRVALRTEGYAPGNIPKESVLVGDGVDRIRLAKLQEVVTRTLSAGLPLASARRLVAIRQAGYLMSLVTTVGVVVWLLYHGYRTQGLASAASAAVSVSGLAGLAWDVFAKHGVALTLVLAVLVGGWVMSLKARRTMHDRFADIWRRSMQELRPPS
jgi:hypothetical protein